MPAELSPVSCVGIWALQDSVGSWVQAHLDHALVVHVRRGHLAAGSKPQSLPVCRQQRQTSAAHHTYLRSPGRCSRPAGTTCLGAVGGPPRAAQAPHMGTLMPLSLKAPYTLSDQPCNPHLEAEYAACEETASTPACVGADSESWRRDAGAPQGHLGCHSAQAAKACTRQQALHACKPAPGAHPQCWQCR